MKKRFSGFILVGLIACSLGAVWSVQAADDQFAEAEEDLLFADIDSVYSASKHEQKTTEAPAKVSIVTAQEIARYGYRTLDELLNSQAGFYNSYDRNYGYTGVRGFGVPGDYNSRILLLVDGHRVNDNLYDAAVLDRNFLLDIDLIERVEIVRGPSSSLYGSNAFFAIINVISKNGRDLNGLEFSAGAGTYDSYQGRISYGKRLHSGLEVLLSTTYYDSNGKEHLYYSDFDTPATNNGIAENADDEQTQSLFARISYGNLRVDAAYLEREKGVPTAPWDTEFNDPRTRAWDSYYYLDLNYQHFNEASGTDFLMRLFYDNYLFDGNYILDYGGYLVNNMDFDDGRFWGTELQLTKNFGDRHTFILGGEYRDSIRQHQKNFDVEGIYLDSKKDVDTWGVFLQDEWVIVKDTLLFNLGVRHDHYDISGKTTNPRAAVILSPSTTTTLKLLYGEAFRAPSIYELYYHDGGETTVAANFLDPETIDSFEFVLEQKIGSSLLGSFSLFHNEINNLIVTTLYDLGPDGLPDTDDERYIFANSQADTKAVGFELSLEGKWANGLATSLNYTYQDAEDGANGEWLVNSPRNMVKANFMAPIIGETLFGGLEMRYESARRTIADDRTGDFYYATAKLISKNLVESLTLDLTVYNLFDEDYNYPASEEHAQDMIEQDGRTFWLNVSYLH